LQCLKLNMKTKKIDHYPKRSESKEIHLNQKLLKRMLNQLKEPEITKVGLSNLLRNSDFVQNKK
jgi:hypothetical protein